MLTISRKSRKRRIRAKITGNATRPRLSIFRSNKAVYAQAIDDKKSVTIVEAHGTKPQEVGAEIAKKLKAKKVTALVFDRGGYRYHGRIQVLADAIRQEGIKF
ncbi:50S ribosomal protein L18 [Candidatus Microgenomates bacterium]|nr:MAG: 50S ribosomal protein L18 [Candidatus Microgenomates bacterium]